MLNGRIEFWECELRLLVASSGFPGLGSAERELMAANELIWHETGFQGEED